MGWFSKSDRSLGSSLLEVIGNAMKTSFPARAVAVTPDNDVIFDKPCTVYVGTAGDVEVVPADAETPDPVVFANVPAGSPVPVAVKSVRESTTAGDLVRVW